MLFCRKRNEMNEPTEYKKQLTEWRMSQAQPEEQWKAEQKKKKKKKQHSHTATRVNYGKWQIVQTQHTAQHNICVSNLVFCCCCRCYSTADVAVAATSVVPVIFHTHSPAASTFRPEYFKYFIPMLLVQQKQNSITNEICLLAIWNAQC